MHLPSTPQSPALNSTSRRLIRSRSVPARKNTTRPSVNRLGNQFLANIREVDAIVHVVRCFEDSNIVHVDGSIDPLRDIETINLELIFSDLEILERRIAKVVKLSRNDKTAAKELELLKRIKEHLEENKMAKSFTTDDEEEQEWLTSYNLLTYKPVIFAANVTEDDLANDGADNASFVTRMISLA